MQDENKLFDLIKSLSKAEKRYVNLNLSKYESKFRFLFEEINKLTVNNEEELKKKYAYNIIEQNGALELNKTLEQVLKSYAPDKRMLYKRILSAIRGYKSTNSAEQKLVKYTQDISVLLDKGLYDHAKSILKKAKKIALTESLHLQLLKLLQFERNHVINTSDKLTTKQLNRVRKEELAALENLKIDLAYKDLADTTYQYTRENYELRSKEKQQWVDEVYKHPLIKSGKSATTFDRKIWRLQTLANIEHLSGKDERAKNYSGMVVQEFYKNPDIIEHQMYRYLKALNNYITSCYKFKDYDEALRVIHSFADYRKRSLEEQAQIFSNITYQKLYYYLNTNQLHLASDFMEELIKGYNKYEKLIPLNRKLAMFANIASFRFLNEHFDMAAMWAEKMLDERMENVRLDLKNYALLILLICYCELGDERLATKYYRRFSTQIRNDNTANSIEDKVIGPIYKIRKNGPYHHKDKSKILNKLQRQLRSYTGVEFAGLSELKLWVGSKCTGQSILSLSKEYAV